MGLERRTALLVAQSTELTHCLAKQAKARRSLKRQHTQERACFFSLPKRTPIQWAALVIRQSEQLLELVERSSLERHNLLTRQEEQLRNLDTIKV